MTSLQLFAKFLSCFMHTLQLPISATTGHSKS